MSVDWDFYRRRQRIDLIRWKEQHNIVTYSDFLKVLRSLAVSPVQPTHPDLVIMGITGGDEARRILEEREAWVNRPSPFQATGSEVEAIVESSKKVKTATKEKEDRLSPFGPEDKKIPAYSEVYSKSTLLKMKKSDLLTLCTEMNVSLSTGKQTKASIISDIISVKSSSSWIPVPSC